MMNGQDIGCRQVIIPLWELNENLMTHEAYACGAKANPQPGKQLL